MLQVLFPSRCGCCRAPGTALCPRCATSLPAAPDLAPPPGLDECWALLAYEGPTRELVQNLKYRNHRDIVGPLGPALAELLVQLPARSGPPVVTWCPTSAHRRRARGYDQAELLARAAAREAGLAVAPLLRRGPGAPQTGRTRADRLLGPRFGARRGTGRVVVVDDVRTTGATLAAAASALRAAGWQEVDGITLAARP